jgi:superfamily II DNA or RNA helicase
VPEPTADVPPHWSKRVYVDANVARQLLVPSTTGEIEKVETGWRVRTPEGKFDLRERGVTPKGTRALETDRTFLETLPRSLGVDDLRWNPEDAMDPRDVRRALADQFKLRIEDPRRGTPGLRIPQVGAWHAVLSHWSTGTTEPATVVLPTGTGKTETMVALFASEAIELLLVLVPSHNLRTQIAEAFEAYGVLPDAGVVNPQAPRPIVGRIEHHFEDLAAMRKFVTRCNVLVTTPTALQASRNSVVEALVRRCSHLFVDEAHHVAAATWSRIRDAFAGKPVVQFTATPYRTDGERLGGRMIYSFPLGRAQELGYFERINYVSVVALANPDRAVAQEAVTRLRNDRESNLDHLIMARVSRIGRARDVVLPLYQDIAPDLEPQILHSELSAQERRSALEAINERRSRIVICVDMLGEGFDFPELKIAALHDPHRSLGVALQFIGRFARSRSDLGTATAVVARPEPGYDPRLRALYAERGGWDSVINDLSSEAVEEVRELDEFEEGFTETGEERLSIHVLRPKMSTVVYETACTEWDPARLARLFDPDNVVAAPTINPDEHVVWTVVESRSGVRWGDLSSVENVVYHLHVLYWDKNRALLYINSSDLDSLHEDLASAVCGSEAARITGDRVYRALGDLKRPVPTNVGVIDLRNRSRRFSMHVGADVYEGFPVAEQQTRSNTNIFVVGFEDGERVTMGAARKGRIWSQRGAESILEWVRWCRDLGPKLQDASINLDALFRSFVRPKPLDQRPELIPLAIDWPWLAFAGMGSATELQVGEHTARLVDVELVITEQKEQGAIPFVVRGEGFEVPYEVEVRDGQLVHQGKAEEALVRWERRDPEPLSQYLDREGTTIWFEGEVLIEGPFILELKRGQPPIDLNQLVERNWAGIDLQRESQGPERDPATIQARAATTLTELRDWDVVIDDDGTAEIADLVALKDEGDRLVVHLVHCKYSLDRQPGARVGDLYEVCGQAHRSAHHRQDIAAMMQNLVRRERRRREKELSGLLVGDDDDLLRLEERARFLRPDLHITIVQPGLSKAQAATNQLRLLGCADLYVREIAAGSFDVWCSP